MKYGLDDAVKDAEVVMPDCSAFPFASTRVAAERDCRPRAAVDETFHPIFGAGG
jgi:hypothetical protein